jgi:hypothetical protein
MNRRSFLTRLVTGAASLAVAQVLESATLDPEKLLWVPGEKSFFLPPEKTFSTYSEADQLALERAIGVLRFYDNGARPRAVSFNRWRPDQSLGLLSDQEVKLAIETGYSLAPGLQAAIKQHGKGHDLQALYTSGVRNHGHYTGRLYRPNHDFAMGGEVYQHGQNLLTGPFDPSICTQRTDRGIVVIGHHDRKGL